MNSNKNKKKTIFVHHKRIGFFLEALKIFFCSITDKWSAYFNFIQTKANSQCRKRQQAT